MGTKTYITGFTSHDRKRFFVETKKGKVVSFVVQYEMLINERWLPVVRYDTIHGYAHKDVLNFQGRVVEKIKMIGMSYNKALEIADADIDSNWRMYKERFLKRR